MTAPQSENVTEHAESQAGPPAGGGATAEAPAASAEPASAEPASVEPASAEPTSAEPASAEPTSSASAEPPAGGEPTSSASAEPAAGGEPTTTAAQQPEPSGEHDVATDAATPTSSADAGSAGEDDSEEAEGDDTTDSGAPEAAAAEGENGAGTPGAPKKKRRRRKKKKPADAAAAGAPPREGEQHRRPSHRASDRAPFHVGEEVFGKVTAVLDTAVMIDLSGKALAIFDRSEMEADDLIPSIGDRFVARVHNDGIRGGLVVLSRKPLREEEIKPKVEQAHKEGTLISGLVTGVIKGGVEVDIFGLRAFAPASGMDLHPQNANFASLVGQRMDFKVVQYEKGGRDVVVTRRPMLEAEAHERRKHALTLLQEGQVMQGVVRTVVEWGAFVALPEAENLEGLVHVTKRATTRALRLQS
jgi:small subunit ribosomal protein S1